MGGRRRPEQPEGPEDVAGWRWPELFLLLFLPVSLFLGADAVAAWSDDRRWLGWTWWVAATALGAALGFHYGARSSLRRRDAVAKRLDVALAIVAVALARPVFAVLGGGLDAAVVYALVAGFLAIVPLVHLARVMRALGG